MDNENLLNVEKSQVTFPSHGELGKKGRGRPRKYATPEEAKEAQLQKINEAYKKNKTELKPRGRKPFMTADELRAKQRERYHRNKDKKENN